MGKHSPEITDKLERERLKQFAKSNSSLLKLGFPILFLAHDLRGPFWVIFCHFLPAPQICKGFFQVRQRFFSGTGDNLSPVAPFFTLFHAN
jgi:hypothetical protein